MGWVEFFLDEIINSTQPNPNFLSWIKLGRVVRILNKNIILIQLSLKQLILFLFLLYMSISTYLDSCGNLSLADTF